VGKLVVGTFVTADGVMQAPGGPDEDRDGGFEHGGWTVNFWNEPMGMAMDEQISRCGTLLFGRRTYEIFAAHWPSVGDEDPFAARVNSMPKYVASRTLKEVTWNNSHLLLGDAAEAVAKLKEETTDEIQVPGSSDFIQTLLEHGLVDEFVLWVFPVVIGTGKRLFGAGARPAAMKLRDTKTFETGVAIHTYEPSGEIPYGTFEVDEHGETAALWN
jgi:dihydrofolate reductase